jgi:predicted acyltransferase
VVSAVLTLAMALPAAIAVHRSDAIWPLRLLREAALLFALLSAMAHFATEGFAALISLSIGLLAMAILSYHLHLRQRAQTPIGPDGKAAASANTAQVKEPKG